MVKSLKNFNMIKKFYIRLVVCLMFFVAFAIIIYGYIISNKQYVAEYSNKNIQHKNFALEEDNENKININKATYDDLLTVGVSKKLARSIIEYREKNGDFSYPEDIIYIKGIGKKTLDKIINYIYVE